MMPASETAVPLGAVLDEGSGVSCWGEAGSEEGSEAIGECGAASRAFVTSM